MAKTWSVHPLLREFLGSVIFQTAQVIKDFALIKVGQES
jgi:hypothetical protein